MPTNIAGDLRSFPGNARIAIAAARFNSSIVERLVEGACDLLTRHGVADDRQDVVRCPGCWELPLVAKRLAESGKYTAVNALGCVIRGETPHFDYVAGECAKGLAQVQMASGIPVIFGVLTTDTTDQAWARAGIKAGNKGADAAIAAIEMADLLGKLA